MKHLVITLLLATLCAVTGHGQTIKSLGYNTTNGQVIAATNVVWTNAFSFSTNTVAAQVRSNLGLGNISTNTVFSTQTAVFVNTNFFATNGSAHFTNLQTRYLEFGGSNGCIFVVGTNATNIVFEEPVARTNFLHGLGVGPTNSVIFANTRIGNDTYIDSAGISWGGNDRIQLEEMKFVGGAWEVDGGAFNVIGETNKAITRTNLGLPLPALTNDSNVTMMRALSGSTNTNEPYSGSVSLTNTNTLVFSNGILLRTQ